MAVIFRDLGDRTSVNDFASVDKEKHDGGSILAHKAFWNFYGEVRLAQQ